MSLDALSGLPPLARALSALLRRVEPGAPESLHAATRLLVALEARGHTALPLQDGGRAALAEAGLQGADWAAALPADAARAREAWAGSVLVQIDPTDARGVSPLVLQGDRLALRRHWRDERRAAAHLQARLGSLGSLGSLNAPCAAAGGAALAPLLDALFPRPPGAEGPDAQRDAARLALHGRITLITGGPGTGKTWTAARVLVLLQALHGAAAPLRMALAAPTGKAAARLRQAIELALQQLQAESAPALVAARDAVAQALATQPARTLDATLGHQHGTRRFVHGVQNPLAVDLLLVDEASMVHGEMLAAMLDALPPSARLVLLGDRDQLASVEAGAVMAELCAPGSPLSPQTTVLQAGHRFGGPIAALAAAINRGDTQGASAAFAAGTGDGEGEGALAWLEHRGPERLWRLAADEQGHGAFVRLLRQRPAEASAFEPWLHALLQGFDGFRVLTAVREGPFGSRALNARLAERLGGWTGGEGWFEGRPVMVTRNDAALGVFNGDVGLAITPPGAASPRVWFRDGAALRSVAASRLPAVETAYAMTVHKSQGSEFGHVLLVLPADDVPVLTREWVYTGVTRARRQLTVLAPLPALWELALQRRTRRFSGLAAALADVMRATGGRDEGAT